MINLGGQILQFDMTERENGRINLVMRILLLLEGELFGEAFDEFYSLDTAF